MIDQLLERREEWNERRRGHIAELRKRAAEAEAKLKRLYEAIENSVVDMADPSLKDRIAELTSVRDQAQAGAERATSAVERLGSAITSDSLRRFTTASPWRHEVAAADAIRPDNQRRTAILRYASWAAVFPIRGWSGYPSAAAISINPGNGAIGQKQASKCAALKAGQLRPSTLTKRAELQASLTLLSPWYVAPL